jgi:uncharacterized protein YqeY|tara:strand:- start:358830 stop:359291 length:462 start_codon:yes stop_codon:yes gene_type:complete
MPDLRQRINTAMKTAMKEKDTVSLSTIRLISAAIKERDIKTRTTSGQDGISEEEILSLLQSMIKQRQESFRMYSEAERPELAEREETEVSVIQGFLPTQLSADEVDSAVTGLIDEVGAESIKDMGKVMAALKTQYAGKLDMANASSVIKEKLG